MDIVAKGIDVSRFQGKIDWQKVKASGIEFAMVRAGWTWYEGGLDVDVNFKTNMDNAIAAGMPVGVYVYSYDHSVAAAEIAAKLLIDLVAPYQLSYPIAFDMEYEEFNKTTGRGAVNTNICIAFLDAIEQAGYYASLYCSKDFFNNYLELNRLKRFDKWVAQYSSECTFADEYGMWQYTNKGKVEGISGDVDMDYAYKDYPKLIEDNNLNNPNLPTENETIAKLQFELKTEKAKNVQTEAELRSTRAELATVQQSLQQLKKTIIDTTNLLLTAVQK